MICAGAFGIDTALHPFATHALRPAVTRRIGILHLVDRPLSAAAAGFLEIFRPMLLAAIR